SESTKSGVSASTGASGGGGGRAQVTFSRPEGLGGVEAQLSDQLDKARKRTLSSSGGGEGRGGAMLTPVSGPESSDRESGRRRTLGSRVASRYDETGREFGERERGGDRDGARDRDGVRDRERDRDRDRDSKDTAAMRAAAAVVHAADRSAAISRVLQPTQSSAARVSPTVGSSATLGGERRDTRRRTVTDLFPNS
ncbi:hypothetical protein CVT24_000823, partial [Panaeolus cyanescens]